MSQGDLIMESSVDDRLRQWREERNLALRAARNARATLAPAAATDDDDADLILGGVFEEFFSPACSEASDDGGDEARIGNLL